MSAPHNTSLDVDGADIDGLSEELGKALHQKVDLSGAFDAANLAHDAEAPLQIAARLEGKAIEIAALDFDRSSIVLEENILKGAFCKGIAIQFDDCSPESLGFVIHGNKSCSVIGGKSMDEAGATGNGSARECPSSSEVTA